MQGTAGADVLSLWSDTGFTDGKAGNDTIVSGSGNNEVLGGEGDDVISDPWGNDTLEGGAGNDTITDSYGDDVIDGGSGDDVIVDQGYGSNVLRGGEGNDTITFSFVASNTIEGGTGNDLIQSDNLHNGMPWQANTIAGGAGDDRLESGMSADTYRFNRGDGNDTICDFGYSNAYWWGGQGADAIVFGPDITADQLWFRHVGNDLKVDVIGAADSITIENWYAGSAYHIESFKVAEGKALADTQVELLVQAMASFEPPAAGQMTMPLTYQESLTPVLAANWK